MRLLMLIIGVIPKSSSPERVVENGRIFDFEITEEDMRLLNSLNTDHHYCWDSTDVT